MHQAITDQLVNGPQVAQHLLVKLFGGPELLVIVPNRAQRHDELVLGARRDRQPPHYIVVLSVRLGIIVRLVAVGRD